MRGRGEVGVVARWALPLCLVAGLACGDDGGPGSVEGNYALQTLNGEPLPYDNDGLGCCWYLSGALALDAGQYTISITARNFGDTDPFTVTEWGAYVSSAAALTFAPDSFDLVALLLSPAAVTGDTVALGLGGEGPGAPDQFQARFVRDR
jgi:hypothetical protein